MLKQVILVPTYLNMGVGKIASQCCWAAMESRTHPPDKRIILKVETVDELTALVRKAYAFGNAIVVRIIIDEGLTEVPKGSVTAVSLVGIEEHIDQITGELKLL